MKNWELRIGTHLHTRLRNQVKPNNRAGAIPLCSQQKTLLLFFSVIFSYRGPIFLRTIPCSTIQPPNLQRSDFYASLPRPQTRKTHLPKHTTFLQSGSVKAQRRSAAKHSRGPQSLHGRDLERESAREIERTVIRKGSRDKKEKRESERHERIQMHSCGATSPRISSQFHQFREGAKTASSYGSVTLGAKLSPEDT